jgi:hypothetical protein
MAGASCSRACAVGLLITLLGCGARRDAVVPTHVAEWLRADPQRCLLVRDLGENMEAMARRCAELFVAENGYTDLPAAEDSTRWVLEGDELGSWPRVLAARVDMLDRDATTVQCSARQCVVFFRYRRAPTVCAYRIVTMTQVFTKIKLEPQGIQDVRCTERRA